MHINFIMLAFFGVVMAGLAMLYMLSRNKYDDYVAPLDEKEYRLKQLFPMGLYIMEAVRHSYNTSYDRGLYSKITEIYGAKYAQYYLQIHWANKIAFFLLGLGIISFLGLGIGPDPGFLVFALVLLGAIVYFTDNELTDKVKKRRLAIQLDFPDFINKLTLLINAGMTVSRAWEKVVTDNRKERPLYDELGLTLADIRAGKPEFQAYEDFAKRCRIPEITKFISVVLQNLKKGNAELVAILQLQASECWEMRKHAAKRLGEEASTKMLLPMMIMFFAILIIVAMPAILALKGI